jgi:hypothetical protein
VVFGKQAMIESVSHNFEDETPQAKAKWFQSLSLEERMEVFVAFTNLILENNPDIVNQKDVRPLLKDVRILMTSGTNSNRED